MDKLDFEHLLRYLTIGFVLTGLIFVCEPRVVYEYIKKLGPAGYTVASFTTGTLLYLVYRNTFYPFFFIPIKDCLTKDNYRMFLKKEYGIRSKRQAEVLWFTFQNLNLMAEYKNLRIYSSGIHLLYMSFLLSCVALIYCFATGQKEKAYFLVSLALACVFSAIYSDMAAEKGEVYLLKQVDRDKIATVVNKITGGERQPICAADC